MACRRRCSARAISCALFRRAQPSTTPARRHPATQDSQIVPTLVFGYEYQLTANTNLNLQAYVSQSVYSSDETDLDELTGKKYQYSIGFRHRRDNVLFTFGFTENVQNVNNTPDVGLQLGFAYIPQRR